MRIFLRNMAVKFSSLAERDFFFLQTMCLCLMSVNSLSLTNFTDQSVNWQNLDETLLASRITITSQDFFFNQNCINKLHNYPNCFIVVMRLFNHTSSCMWFGSVTALAGTAPHGRGLQTLPAECKASAGLLLSQVKKHQFAFFFFLMRFSYWR